MVRRLIVVGLIVAAGCTADPQGTGFGGPDAVADVSVAPPPGLEVLASLDVAPTLDAEADQGPMVDAAVDAVVDAVAADTGPVVLPETLRPETWLAHLQTDILPFWTSSVALGSPTGNFPTYRGMDGTVQSPSERRPRMISRQVFALAVGFLMTGDASLLGHAQAGTQWLQTHASDATHGGFHARLDAGGNPLGEDDKTAQDAAYVGLGPSMVAFVSRDPVAQAVTQQARDMLMDPTTFFDSGAGRVRDAMNASLTAAVDLEADGGAELVAQLDPITALLLHAERGMPPAQAAQARDDLVTLGIALLAFFDQGMVWGVSNQVGVYGGKHTDFGHALKAVWALHLIDARVPTPAFASAVSAHGQALLDLAYDPQGERWAKRPQSATTVEYGSDWWSYAEADQLQATLADAEGRDRLALTAGHWLTDYVDATRPLRELVPSIDRFGGWVWNWTDDDTAKCNQWKSGYHSSEHALVMYLAGHAHQGTAATLHFALDATTHDPATEALYPYVFGGQEVDRRVGATAQVGGRTLTLVEVDFLVSL